MALGITGENPIVVTGTTAVKETIIENGVKIIGIVWDRPTTAGHIVRFLDSTGQFKCRLYASMADTSMKFDIPFTSNGLVIDDLDSGTVYIYKSVL